MHKHSKVTFIERLEATDALHAMHTSNAMPDAAAYAQRWAAAAAHPHSTQHNPSAAHPHNRSAAGLLRRAARQQDAAVTRRQRFSGGGRNATGGSRRPQRVGIALTSYVAHFDVLSQYFLSFETNVRDAHRCKHLVVVSTPEERAQLQTTLEKHAPRLPRVSRSLAVHTLPSVIETLEPNATISKLPTAKNRGRLGRLYVCLKKAYALRYMHERLDVEHVLVTDSEAYVWKPLSIVELFAHEAARPTVWFADAPSLHGARAHKDPPPVDANWCAVHVYADARGSSAAALHAQLPGRSPTATLFEYMGFFYERDAFRGYWSSVLGTWRKPAFFDALVAAHEAAPACVGVGFWFEVSWLLYLHNRHAATYEARNVTAAIEASFGDGFVRKSLYVNARLELLTRALTNATLPRFADFFERTQLPFFRCDFRGASGRQGSRGGCLPVQLVNAVAAPAASFQVNSAVPNWAWSACREHLPAQDLPWVPHRIKT